MNINFKPAMAALFAHLCSAAVVTFTADASAGSAILTNASTVSGLIIGIPVFGPGVAGGTIIADVDGDTVTLSAPIATGAGGTDLAFTAGFLTTGRRVIHWSKVSDQPALFLRRTGVRDLADDDGMVATTLECEAWIYCNAGQDPDAEPDDALTALESMIRSAFLPMPTDDEGRCTLGGQVYWARIEGNGDISPGDQGGQAIARIPILVTIP